MPTPTATIFLPYHALDDVILRGTRAAQPAASAVVAGTLYGVTDEGNLVERSTGTVWQAYSPTGGGGGAGTGDVVGPGAATDDAIALYDGTTGKLIQDSATTIPALTASITSSVTASVIPVDLATETTGTLPLAALPAHHTRHEPGGADALTVDAAAATGSLRTLGTGANQAAAGTDSRLTNARTPTAHHTTHNVGGSDPVDVQLLAGYPGTSTTYLSGTRIFTTVSTLPGAHHASHEPGGADALVNAAWTTQANVFTASQEVALGAPLIAWRDTAQPAGARVFRLVNYAQLFRVEATDDAQTIVQATPLSLNRIGDLTVTGAIADLGRVTPLGYWTTAALGSYLTGFTGSYLYSYIGKTLLLTVNGSGTLASAAPFLTLLLPSGTTAAFGGNLPFWLFGAAWIPGMANFAGAGASSCDLYPNGTSWPAGAVTVSLACALPIQ